MGSGYPCPPLPHCQCYQKHELAGLQITGDLLFANPSPAQVVLMVPVERCLKEHSSQRFFFKHFFLLVCFKETAYIIREKQ